ncbi:LrgB family protein [Rhizobiaceae bacterium BDR2-2]|uniref:LrgB family protein n=1 Tax=Ectorhizobium quercum TaxID=2965071 RepID=A0AAE3N1P9_9HYPH|nr:LrgB family protein [Ectorhizobium quercum]MCX8998944.1 LrgB family protein [Ectorhizobium quercum]
MLPNDPVFQTVFWSVLTIVLYMLAKRLYRRLPRTWTSPLLLTPVMLIVAALTLHTGYADYIRSTHWLMLLLGPATVAFAIPIYEQRDLIRRTWPVLVFGVTAGSITAIACAYGMAHLLGLTDTLRLSLLPRSISTPFAMTISSDIGGVPDLTALFVVVTGVTGAAVGDILLKFVPVRTPLARGALFGMGAHGAGVARATQIGSEEGSIAGLVMVLVGLVNVLSAPLLALLLRA